MVKRIYYLLFYFSSLLLLTFAGCRHHDKSKPVSFQQTKTEVLKANLYFDKCFAAAIDRDPEMQTVLGIKKDYNKWRDHSNAFDTLELAIAKKELDDLHKEIDIEKLNNGARISYRYFEYNCQQVIDGYRWRFHNYPVNQVNGFQVAVPAFLINMHCIRDISDARAYIERLKGIGKLFDQETEGLRIRDSMNIIPPKFVFPLVIKECRNIITGEPFDYSGKRSPLFDDFISKIDTIRTIDGHTKAKLKEEVNDALINVVKPAYDKLITFLTLQSAKATDDDGIWKWPDGKEFYKFALQRITATHLTPEKVYQTGEQEIQRIHKEMQDHLSEMKYRGNSLNNFFDTVRINSRSYFDSSPRGKEAYIRKAHNVINTMKNNLDRFFNVQLNTELEVKAVEPFREESAPNVFYVEGVPVTNIPAAAISTYIT